MKEFTHLDQSGKPLMVDVHRKKITERTAVARSIVSLPPEVRDQLVKGDIQTKKGSVFQTAVLAGIMASKRTGELIPLCHPLALDSCKIDIRLSKKSEVVIECTVSIEAKTGVEMEALVGASIAALTVYDMCKAFSHDITIRDTRLIKKSGGKKNFERKK